MSEMNRRDFVIAAAAAGVAMTVLNSPLLADGANQGVDVGTVADYPSDGLYDKMAKKPNMIVVVRKDNKIYAYNSACTHRGCPVSTKGDQLFCACHKSTFDGTGKPVSGPAKAALFRFGISLNDQKRIMVDKTKQFGEKQWGDPGASISAA